MKNNIFKFFIFIIFNSQIHSSFAVELKLDDIKNKINDIKNNKEVVSGSPQFQMLSVLEDITNELNKQIYPNQQSRFFNYIRYNRFYRRKISSTN